MDNTFIVDVGSCALKHGTVRKARRGGSAAAGNSAQQPTPHVVPNEGNQRLHGDASCPRSGADVEVGGLAPQLSQLLAKSSLNANDYTLLFLVHPLASARAKEFLVRSAFEELAARRVCIAYAPVTALLGVGCTSGVVVDMGYRATTVVPVWNGTPISHLVDEVVGQGSHAVDVAFAEALRHADDSFPSVAQLVQHHGAGFLHQLKLDCASLQPGLRAPAPSVPLVLPDGTTLKSPLSTEDYVACTQQALLRGTSLLYTTQQATRNLLRLHPNASPMIPWVLIGGAAAIPGVESYFLEGLGAAKGMLLGKDLLHQQCRDPTTASWAGASIMAQLSTFLAPSAASLPSFGTFEELCGPQLAGSGVPYDLWGILFDKLRHDVFDAGDAFQLATIEEPSDDEEDDASTAEATSPNCRGPAVLTTLRSMKAIEDVWILDHAWTFRVRDARRTLTENTSLCQRLGAMLLGDPEASVSAVYDAMWFKASTYRIATEATLDEECCWYLMDEVGSAIRHVLSEADGNCRCIPLFYTPGNIAVSVLWMTKETDEGDIVSFSNWRERSQCPGVHALLHGLEVGDDVDEVKDEVMTASRMVLETADEMWVASKQRRDASRTDAGPASTLRVLARSTPQQRFLVACDLPELVDNIRSVPEASAQYDFTPSVADADIVWLAEYQADGMRAPMYENALFVSQMGIEAVLCHKERLQRALRRAYGNPEWLPRTYDAASEMHLFAGDYLARAARGDNNLWIVKPHCMARSMDMVVTDCLPLLLRQSETGPKIICKYVENPCLFRGRKFDLRLIVAVQQLHPARRVYMYRRVWPRFALEPYSLSDFDVYEKHWTVMNYANPEKMINLLHDPFVAEFDETHGVGSWASVTARIHRMTLDVFDAVAQDPEVPCNPNGAAIYGLDVMLTESLSPVLLEATFAPDCHRACVQYPTFFSDVFSTLFEDNPQNFEPLFDASKQHSTERQLLEPRLRQP